MLATAADPNLGGRDFDKFLVHHFANEFKVSWQLLISICRCYRGLVILVSWAEDSHTI